MDSIKIFKIAKNNHTATLISEAEEMLPKTHNELKNSIYKCKTLSIMHHLPAIYNVLTSGQETLFIANPNDHEIKWKSVCLSEIRDAYRQGPLQLKAILCNNFLSESIHIIMPPDTTDDMQIYTINCAWRMSDTEYEHIITDMPFDMLMQVLTEIKSNNPDRNLYPTDIEESVIEKGYNFMYWDKTFSKWQSNTVPGKDQPLIINYGSIGSEKDYLESVLRLSMGKGLVAVVSSQFINSTNAESQRVIAECKEYYKAQCKEYLNAFDFKCDNYMLTPAFVSLAVKTAAARTVCDLGQDLDDSVKTYLKSEFKSAMMRYLYEKKVILIGDKT